jgi:hypothetical protein
VDAFEELMDITRRLQRLTRHSDGVVSIHINAEAWDDLEGSIRASRTFRDMVNIPIERGQGADSRGRRFELMGVEFVDYDRVTGLPTKR